MKHLIAVALIAVPTTVLAATITRESYSCERDASVEAVYIRSEGPKQAIVFAEGNIAVLSHVPASSGARYQGNPLRSHYVWWINDDDGMLGWYDADSAEELVVLGKCRLVDE